MSTRNKHSTPLSLSSSSSSSQRQQRQRDEERNHHRQLMTGRRPNNNSSSNTNTISEAQNIQKSLQRTHGLLQNELQRVSYVTSAIQQDGQLLEETKTSHKSLHTKQAQKALNSLQYEQRKEQYILGISILWFLLVTIYIVWCRILLRIDIITPSIKFIWKNTCLPVIQRILSFIFDGGSEL